MELAEAQAAIQAANGDKAAISDEVNTFLAGYAPPTTDGMITQEKANAMVASARKKLEAQNASAEAKIAEMTEQFEELQNRQSGTQDTERQMEKLLAKLKAAQEQAEAAQAETLGVKKNMAMSKIHEQIGWADGIGQDARDALVLAKFGALDLGDLTDADAMKPIIAEFRDANPWAVAGSVASGTGGGPGGADTSGGVKEVSMSQMVELAKTDRAKYDQTMKAVWEGQAAGKVKLVA